MVIQLLQKAICQVRGTQYWFRDGSDGYKTEIFEKHDTIAPRVLAIYYSAKHHLLINPPSEEERRIYSDTARGPLTDGRYNAELMIFAANPELNLPKYSAYFLDGRFVYAEKNDIPEDSKKRLIVEDYYTVDEFKRRLQTRSKMPSFDEFRNFFTKSNLPEAYRKSIDELLR